MRIVALTTALLLIGCNKDEEAVDTGEPAVHPEPMKVMRDCPADVGTICPWAGAGYNGYNGDAVHRLDASFSFPMSVTFHPGKDPIVSDWNNHKLRSVLSNPEDGFETIMGTDFLGDGDPGQLDNTDAGAPGTDVNLNHPTQQEWFSDGTLLSASWHTHKLRTWDPATKLVHVYLGGAPGFSGVDFEEPADTTLLNQPKQILIDRNDESKVYILDMRNERIRVLDRSTWTVDTVAGNGEKCEAWNGADVGNGGPALSACFSFPKNANPEPGGALALNAESTLLYIADSENHIIRVVDLTTGQIDLLSGTPGVSGHADGAAASALWNYPVSFALDNATNELFVADANNHRVRVIDLNTKTVSTVAGNGHSSCETPSGLLVPETCDNQHDGGDGGPALEATLYRPFGVDIDLDGNLVVSDTYNHRIRVVYR